MAPPTARFQIAFTTTDMFDDDPAWEDLDDALTVSSWSLDRGRAFELDRVDTGRATVTLNDTEGALDPTNTGSPYWNIGDGQTRVQPLKQARLALWNPVLEDWYTRFRGYVEGYTLDYDPSQYVNRVTVTLIDVFEIIQAVQMFPGYFGDPAPSVHAGNVFMEDTLANDPHGMQRRIIDIIGDDIDSSFSLGSVGLPSTKYVVLSGNVSLHESVYSPGESAMAAVTEASDAEFPGVANVFVDRLGRLTALGRYAKFDPVGTAAATDWDFQDWKAGDGTAVLASPLDTAHIRAFSISRDLSKVINHATASPVTNLQGAPYDTAITANVVENTTSKGHYGIRAWETQNLIVKEGVTDGLVGGLGAANTSGWAECRRYADYYVRNYHAPQSRVTQVTFRSIDLAAPGAAVNWDFLCRCDISDRVTITLIAPGGGGFTAEPYFIEGIHQEVKPLDGNMDDVTLTLDLSPGAYFEDSPFA